MVDKTYTQGVIVPVLLQAETRQVIDSFKKISEDFSNIGFTKDTLDELNEATKQSLILKETYKSGIDILDETNEALRNQNLTEETRNVLLQKRIQLQNELLSNLQEQKKAGAISEDELEESEEAIKKDFNFNKTKKEGVFSEWTKSFINGSEGNFGDSLKSAVLSTFGPSGSIADIIVKGVKNVMDKIVNFVQSMIKEAIQKIKSMMTYNLTTTTQYDSDAVSYLEDYGLTGASAYGVKNALNDVGMSSLEDLFKAQAYGMTEVVKRFQERYEFYSNQFNTTSTELSEMYQKFDDEWSDFKNDFQQELIVFFSNNKSLITSTLKLLIDTLPTLLQVVSGILSAITWFTGANNTSTNTKSASDIYNSYGASTNNSSYQSTTNNYTFNGMTQNQLNTLKSSINKGNTQYYNAKAVR